MVVLIYCMCRLFLHTKGESLVWELHKCNMTILLNFQPLLFLAEGELFNLTGNVSVITQQLTALCQTLGVTLPQVPGAEETAHPSTQSTQSSPAEAGVSADPPTSTSPGTNKAVNLPNNNDAFYDTLQDP